MNYLFKYYLFIFFFILQSNIYYKNNKIIKINNIEIINLSYKDYIYWKEGRKIKNINIPLSINTFYNKNSLKKEKIELLSFTNIHYSFNNQNYNNIRLIPNIYFLDKNYLLKKDILYFNVKTPTTQFFYENSIYGQLLQTIFTQNPKNNINYSIHYKSLYPKIKYKNQLLAINYFLSTFNYNDIENKYYKIWTHFYHYYKIKNYNINIIKKIPLLLNNSMNIINNNRLYIGQYIKLYKNIYLLNRLEYEKKLFIYKEKKYENIFGNIYINNPRKNEIYYNKISNNFIIKYFIKKNIFLISGIGFHHLKYNFINKNKINNNIYSFFGNIEYKIPNKVNINIFGKYFLFKNNKNNTYYIFFKKKYNISFNSKIEGRLIFYNISPPFNLKLNKNFYKKNNYFNNFINIKINQLYFNYINKHINIYFNIYNINNYIYLSSKNQPKQYKNNLLLYNFCFYKFFSIKKIKYNIFLKINNNNNNFIFKIPKLITRNCIYYEDAIFKKKILFQTGIILKHFTKNIYNNSLQFLNKKLIYYLLNNNITGGLPFLDYFINIEFFRIKLYFIIENFNIYNFFYKKNSFISKNINNNILIKIGLLWNMFT